MIIKAGDKVVIVGTDEEDLNEFVGQVGIVREVRPHVPFPIYIDFDDHQNVPFAESEVELHS